VSQALLKPFFGIPDHPKDASRHGASCYGLARLVYAELIGVALPDHSKQYLDERDEAEVAAVVNGARSTFWQNVSEPAFLDLILFRGEAHDSHVGIYAEPGWMLHTIKDDVSKFARYDRFPWRGRLEGFYRFIR